MAGGIAATPKAVKDAYDLAASAKAVAEGKADRKQGIYYIVGDSTTAAGT